MQNKTLKRSEYIYVTI